MDVIAYGFQTSKAVAMVIMMVTIHPVAAIGMKVEFADPELIV